MPWAGHPGKGCEQILAAERACSQVCRSRMNWAILGRLHGFLLHGRAIAATAAGKLLLQQDEMGEAATMQTIPCS